MKEKWKINLRGITLANQLVSWNMFLNILMALGETLYGYWPYLLMALLLNDISAGAAHSVLIRDCVLLVAGECLLDILMAVLRNYYFYCGSDIWERANIHLNQKIMKMDYEYMESESAHNLRREIDEEARFSGAGMNHLFWSIEAIVACTLMMLVTLGYTIYILSRCQAAFSGEPLKASLYSLLFLVLIGSLSALIFWKNKSIEKKYIETNEEIIPFTRQTSFYVDEYLSKEEHGKTVRIFHQQNLLAGHIVELFGHIQEKLIRIGKLKESRGKWISVTEALISGVTYFLMGNMVLRGVISIGSVCLYAGCINNFLRSFQNWVNQLTGLSENTKFVKMYFDFLDIPDKKYEGTLPVEKRDDDQFTLEFRHVSFHYPGSEVDVLKDFSIKFRIGERLAVVGKNGSGKTTFIKLLCRLYDPCKGEILLNGIDIRKYDYQEYLSLFSVVFQDFKIPAFSIGQNVAAAKEYDPERAELALRKAGLGDLLEKLPRGLDTYLYTDYDSSGVDISGGEAQKVAIARALYHDTSFVILDEPTAALDPLAEYEIYSKFDELMGSKTAVYISHRLSSCQFCNDILVIDEGRLVQRGSHEELIQEKDSLYYRLWNTQAQHYQ